MAAVAPPGAGLTRCSAPAGAAGARGPAHGAVGRAGAIALAAAGLALAGCPRYRVVDDGSSLADGASNGGRLVRPARLPSAGNGFVIPPRWVHRGLAFGTDELVRLIAHLGDRVSRDYPGAVVAVADLSPERGGPSEWHRSHQVGVDVDLLFFAVDARGRPVALASMPHFGADGTTRAADGLPLFFDVERNWALVRAAIDNPVVPVQYLFVYDPLRQLLLDHAIAIGESADLIEAASYVLQQPGDSANHDDHFHLRIYCPPSDREIGCRDRGDLRWGKKRRKYPPPPPTAPTERVARQLSATALPLFAAGR